MIVQIFADARQLVHQRDAALAQQRAGPDSG